MVKYLRRAEPKCRESIRGCGEGEKRVIRRK